MGRRRCGCGCCSFGRIGGGGHRCHCIVVLVVVVIVVEFIVALIIRLIIKLKKWLFIVVVGLSGRGDGCGGGGESPENKIRKKKT